VSPAWPPPSGVQIDRMFGPEGQMGQAVLHPGDIRIWIGRARPNFFRKLLALPLAIQLDQILDCRRFLRQPARSLSRDETIPSLGNQSPRTGGEDRERPREGDRLVEEAGEPFRTAGAGRSSRQLRLRPDLEGTWPRRRAAMNRSSDLRRALKQRRSRAGTSGAPSTVSPAEPEAAAL
jgi:hypothetical protein